MTRIKPSVLAGFMELSPKEQIAFNELKDIIKNVYESFGFLPIDTPVIEKSEVLLAKGAGETEKQIYRFEKGDTDMALRFDLTVPLARYTAQHFSELNFPFKRYQIGKVYRGERNQKGRFREFYQCDVDIIGNEKLAIGNDAEMPAIIYEIFSRFNFGAFTIKVNNRKLLSGFYKSLSIEDPSAVIRIVDKLEKIGLEKVKEELKNLGLSESVISRIISHISLSGTNEEIICALKDKNIEDEIFNQGLSEMEEFLSLIPSHGVPKGIVKLDMALSRGLDYYTGTIYETVLNDFPEVGSVCGGGRYDNLAEYYTEKSLPGVGISIGLTRLFYKLNEAGLLLTKESHSARALILPMKGFERECNVLANDLRKEGVFVQTDYELGKLGKKFAYADKSGIPFVIVVGEEEVKNSRYTVKKLSESEQIIVDRKGLSDLLRNR